MSPPEHRVSLTALWATCFVLGVLGTLYLRWVGKIGPTASAKLFDLVITQYAPYMGAVLGFHFGAHGSTGRGTKKHFIPYRLAMAMSGLWNLVMVGFIMQACINPNLTEDATNDILAIVPKLSWVVAPAIGFFFGKPADVTK